MALRNAGTEAPTTTTATTGTPAFEGMDEGDTTVIDRAAGDEDELPAQASTSTAVAVTKEQVLQARPALDKNTLMRGLRDAIPIDELEAMGFGVFPRITASLGGFVVNKTEKKLGGRIRFEVLSWSYIDMIVTGEQDNAEANKLIRSSYDGVKISGASVQVGDGTVAAYLAYLKAEGYEKAKVKRYVEVYGNLLAYEQKQGNTMVAVEVPPDEQKLYQISLSPQSVGQWGKYQLEGSLRKARGMADDSLVTLVQAEKTQNSKTYAYAEFEPKW